MSDIDTTTAAIKSHLDTSENHEAGLIPMATQARILALAAERDKLAGQLRAMLKILDETIAESGRGIEWGEEDAFRMGEWFDDDMPAIEEARAALSRITGETP
jgi:hypothetical protein